jgi:WD40 repeat protein
LRDVAFIAFSPDGAWLASGDGYNDVVVADVDRGTLALPKLTGHGDIVLGVAFSPDGRYLASAGMDKTVRLWDAKTGQYLQTFLGHTDVVYTLAFSPDSRQLASGSHDKTIRIWTVAPPSPKR